MGPVPRQSLQLPASFPLLTLPKDGYGIYTHTHMHMETWQHTDIHAYTYMHVRMPMKYICTDTLTYIHALTRAHTQVKIRAEQAMPGTSSGCRCPRLTSRDRAPAALSLPIPSHRRRERERISCPEAATVLQRPRARARMHACRRRDEAWTAGIQSEASMGPQAYTTHIPIASRRLTDEASVGHQGRTVCIRLYRHTLCTVYGYINTCAQAHTGGALSSISVYIVTLPAPADARAVHPHIVLRLQVGAPLDERFDDLRVAVVRGGPKRRPSILHTRRGGRAQHSIAFSSGRATLRGGALLIDYVVALF
jgi:hypothetical protein